MGENAHTQNPFLGSIYIATSIFTQNRIISVKIELSLRLTVHALRNEEYVKEDLTPMLPREKFLAIPDEIIVKKYIINKLSRSQISQKNIMSVCLIKAFPDTLCGTNICWDGENPITHFSIDCNIWRHHL